MLTNNLSKREKIELIKNLASGKINVINGKIIDSGVVLIRKGDEYYLNDQVVDFDEVERKVDAFIILPAKNEIE
ncbi:MAG TPA: hypothetical protein PLC80_01245 [Draconibacterium sp.]|nr:hypothetical protein [Draconibacterium sp.]